MMQWSIIRWKQWIWIRQYEMLNESKAPTQDKTWTCIQICKVVGVQKPLWKTSAQKIKQLQLNLKLLSYSQSSSMELHWKFDIQDKITKFI
jgi:hypothetical protein